MKLFASALVALVAAQDSNRKYGSGSGDPHFVVKTNGQDPVCFDFNPMAGTEMNLLIDPESSLAITATAETRADNGKTFMNSVHFASPAGAHLEFNIDGVHLAGLSDEDFEVLTSGGGRNQFDGRQFYGDLTFVEKWGDDGLHEHTKVQVEDGPTFLIKGNVEKGSLSVAVMDAAGISQKARGIIGQFIRDDAYLVTPTGDVDEDNNKLGNVSAG